MIGVNAQSEKYKIVFDLNDGDTATHSTVLRQFNNILKAAPDAELELVCYGKAVNMFVKDKVYFEEKIKELKGKATVSFKVCANSLKRFNIDKSQVSELAEIVPVAILELSSKQMQGWSYIKAGN
jgi:intracellular sulfur oxidation DsrE/DsrF family protein